SAANGLTLASGPADNTGYPQAKNRPKRSTSLMEILKTRTEPLTSADRLAIGIATAGGVGFVPKAPGTAGSLVGVLFYLFIEGLPGGLGVVADDVGAGFYAMLALALIRYGFRA